MGARRKCGFRSLRVSSPGCFVSSLKKAGNQTRPGLSSGADKSRNNITHPNVKWGSKSSFQPVDCVFKNTCVCFRRPLTECTRRGGSLLTSAVTSSCPKTARRYKKKLCFFSETASRPRETPVCVCVCWQAGDVLFRLLDAHQSGLEGAEKEIQTSRFESYTQKKSRGDRRK